MSEETGLEECRRILGADETYLSLQRASVIVFAALWARTKELMPDMAHPTADELAGLLRGLIERHSALHTKLGDYRVRIDGDDIHIEWPG